MTMQDRLACNSFFLAEIVGQSTKEYNDIYFNRKVFANKKKNDLVKSNMPVSKAELEVYEDKQVLKLWKAERKREGDVYEADLLLKQVNKVLSAMQQRISHLKVELNNTK